MLLVQTFAFNKVILLFPFSEIQAVPNLANSWHLRTHFFSFSVPISAVPPFFWMAPPFVYQLPQWLSARWQSKSPIKLTAPWKHARLGLVHGSHRSFWEDFVPYARDEFRFCHLKVKPSARKKGLAFFQVAIVHSRCLLVGRQSRCRPQATVSVFSPLAPILLGLKKHTAQFCCFPGF